MGGVKSGDFRGSRSKGSPSVNMDPFSIHFHSCMWTWPVYHILAFGRECSPTWDGACKNVGSLEEISMGWRPPLSPTLHLGWTSRPHHGGNRAHLNGRHGKRAVLQVQRFTSPTDELGKRRETKKGSTLQHIPEKVAHPCPPNGIWW